MELELVIKTFKELHPDITKEDVCDVLCHAVCILNRKRKLKWRQVGWDDIKYIMEKWDDFEI